MRPSRRWTSDDPLHPDMRALQQAVPIPDPRAEAGRDVAAAAIEDGAWSPPEPAEVQP